MFYYYKVPLVGEGTDEKPYRPDIPDIDWSGNVVGDWFYIKTPSKLDTETAIPIDEKHFEQHARGG